MAITNFIPTIWSEQLYRSLDKKYVAVANCNRDYEGDIKQCGSSVKICGVGNISVYDYTKNSNMGSPQSLSDTVQELVIDQAKYFNFQIDDIDRAQSTPKLMESAMKIAADALANEADRYIYSLYDQAGSTVTQDDTENFPVMNAIYEALTKLYENNVQDTSDVVLEVTPHVATKLFKEKLTLSTDNSLQMEKGYIGNIAGCQVYVSSNVVLEEPETGVVYHHHCIMRTRRAIAFAEQLSEIQAYRPEQRFADAVKGLHLYGAKVIYPKEMVHINLGSY